MTPIADLISDLWGRNEKSPMEFIGPDIANGGVRAEISKNCYFRMKIMGRTELGISLFVSSYDCLSCLLCLFISNRTRKR